MDIGQAMVVQPCESAETPASVGWLSQVMHNPGENPNYPNGLYEVYVNDSTGEPGDILIDLQGRLFFGMPCKGVFYLFD